jgi:hypothetical protein
MRNDKGESTPFGARRSWLLGHPARSSFALDRAGHRSHVDLRGEAALWKLPDLWTHRTRPEVLGNHRTVSTSFHSASCSSSAKEKTESVNLSTKPGQAQNSDRFSVLNRL